MEFWWWWWRLSFGGVDGGEKGEKMEMVFFLLMKMKVEICIWVLKLLCLPLIIDIEKNEIQTKPQGLKMYLNKCVCVGCVLACTIHLFIVVVIPTAQHLTKSNI